MNELGLTESELERDLEKLRVKSVRIIEDLLLCLPDERGLYDSGFVIDTAIPFTSINEHREKLEKIPALVRDLHGLLDDVVGVIDSYGIED